jgi:uncharacterized protein YcgI (DUF1989 family)
MHRAYEQILRNGQSSALILDAGYRIRITDLVGSQIGSLCAYSEPADGKEFSWKRSLDAALADRATKPPGYAGLHEGDYLLSAQGDRIMRITADTMEVKGITNLHATVCNRQMEDPGDSNPGGFCYEAVYTAAEPWGLEIPTTDFGRYNPQDYLDRLDLFAKPREGREDSGAAAPDPDRRVAFGNDGRKMDYKPEMEQSDKWQTLGESNSRPGDYQEFEAVTQCLVSFANCVYGDGHSMKFEIFV